jgi:chorismate-pyruvate lyase
MARMARMDQSLFSLLTRSNTFVGEILKAKETDKTRRILKALWQMQKLDIKRLKAAFDGKE